jgi:S-adenosyl methyltransferase
MGSDLFGPETSQGLQNLNNRDSQQQYFHRTAEEVARFFDGTDLIPPGLVPVEKWRSEPTTDDARTSGLWAGVGRKR